MRRFAYFIECFLQLLYVKTFAFCIFRTHNLHLRFAIYKSYLPHSNWLKNSSKLVIVAGLKSMLPPCFELNLMYKEVASNQITHLIPLVVFDGKLKETRSSV